MSLDKVEFVLAAAYLFPVMHQDLRGGGLEMTGEDSFSSQFQLTENLQEAVASQNG